MITLPEKCFRGYDYCQPWSQIESTDKTSFMCCGLLDEDIREPPQDKFRYCFKNESLDEMHDNDKRDLIDTISVMSQALSIQENIEANDGT